MDLKTSFRQWLKDHGLSQRTIKEYCRYLDILGEEIDEVSIKTFLEHKPNNVKRAFVNNIKEYITDTEPDRASEMAKIKVYKQRGRAKLRVPKYVTEDEVALMENALKYRKAYRVMLLLSFYSGLRVGGLLSIKAKDFNIKQWLKNTEKSCELKVNEKGDRERIVPVPSTVMELIKDDLLSADPELRLFPVGYGVWWKALKNASIKALGRPISPHVLRHGSATYLLRHGWSLIEVAEFLGHRNISTTQIYTHVDKEKMLSNYDNLFK